MRATTLSRFREVSQSSFDRLRERFAECPQFSFFFVPEGQLLKSTVIWLLSSVPIERIQQLIESARVTRLKRKLGQCGADVVISKGFHVDAPNMLRLAGGVSFGPDVAIMGVGGCTIGPNAMVATRVTILTTTHDRKAQAMRSSGHHARVTIDENVWIGAGAIILPGVRIHSGAVVGAGAVVTEDVEPDQVVVGSPARVIRNRLDP